MKKIYKHKPRTTTELPQTWWQKLLGCPPQTRVEWKTEIEWIVYPSLVFFLEDTARYGSKGWSRECFTDSESRWPDFTVDKGRKKLVIQSSATNEKKRSEKLKLFYDNLPDHRKICVDGKWWEIKVYVKGEKI